MRNCSSKSPSSDKTSLPSPVKRRSQQRKGAHQACAKDKDGAMDLPKSKSASNGQKHPYDVQQHHARGYSNCCTEHTHTTTTNWQANIGRDGHITPAKRVTRPSPDNSVPLGSQLKAPSEGHAMSGDTIKGHQNAPEPASLHHRTRRGAILKQMDRLTIHRIRDISPCLLPTTGPPMTTCPNQAAPRPHLRPSLGGSQQKEMQKQDIPQQKKATHSKQ